MTPKQIEHTIGAFQDMLEMFQARQDAQSAMIIALVTALRDRDAALPSVLKSRLDQAAELHRSGLPKDLHMSRKHFDDCIGHYRLALEVLEGSIAAGTSAAQH